MTSRSRSSFKMDNLTFLIFFISAGSCSDIPYEEPFDFFVFFLTKSLFSKEANLTRIGLVLSLFFPNRNASVILILVAAFPIYKRSSQKLIINSGQFLLHFRRYYKIWDCSALISTWHQLIPPLICRFLFSLPESSRSLFCQQNQHFVL